MTVTIKIKTCNQCPHFDHNGLLQAHPKRVCDKHGGRKILGDMDATIKPPKWCPLREVKEQTK